MKCPMTMNTVGIYGEKAFDEPQDCIEEKCAWWVGGDRVCVSQGIRRELCDIHYFLRKMGEKMSNAGRIME